MTKDLLGNWDYKWDGERAKKVEKDLQLGDGSFIVIESWMITKLNLKGNNLIVFALIHGYTHKNEHGMVTASNNYFAAWTNSSVGGIKKNIKELLKQGLIVRSKLPNSYGVYSYMSMATKDGKVKRIDVNAIKEEKVVEKTEEKTKLQRGYNKVTGGSITVFRFLKHSNTNKIVYPNSYYKFYDSKTYGTTFSKTENESPDIIEIEVIKEEKKKSKPHSASHRSKPKPTVEEKDCQGQQTKQDPDDMENQTDIFDFLFDDIKDEPNMAKAVAESISKRIEEKKETKDDPFAEFMKNREKAFDEDYIF